MISRERRDCSLAVRPSHPAAAKASGSTGKEAGPSTAAGSGGRGCEAFSSSSSEGEQLLREGKRGQAGRQAVAAAAPPSGRCTAPAR